MKSKKTRWLLILAAAVIGGVLGYLYYVNVGCLNGACPIKSDPWKMTGWGVLFGGLLASIVLPEVKKE